MPKIAKRAAQVTAILLIALIISIAGCHRAHAAETFNALALCDRSTSASDTSCTPKRITDVGQYWMNRADDAGGGIFEVFLIDRSFDTTTVLFSESYPQCFPGPVSVNKKKWRNGFLARLSKKTKDLPTNTGSAIAEALKRASLRVPRHGETLIYILSDLREVDGVFNCEKHIPTEKEFLSWLSKRSLRPDLKASTRLVVCGVHPYTPDNTGRMTARNYEQLLKLWTSVFDKWGLQTSISEVCGLNNQN